MYDTSHKVRRANIKNWLIYGICLQVLNYPRISDFIVKIISWKEGKKWEKSANKQEVAKKTKGICSSTRIL